MLAGQVKDDLQLLIDAKGGDAESFGELYERYAGGIFRFLYSRLDNRLDAEDLTGEVFLRAWRSLPDYKDRGLPFSSFLYRVAHNALIDFYRARRNDYELSVESVEIRDQAPEPGEMIINFFEHKELREILDRLSEDYRDVLTARFFSNLSIQETALFMGKSTGAVRVLQHRALVALRRLMEVIQ